MTKLITLLLPRIRHYALIFSLLTVAQITSPSCHAAQHAGWHIEQSSDVVGKHIVEFNDSCFRITNPGNGMEILFDGPSAKLYLLEATKRNYCELNTQNFSGIAAYDFSNLSVGTFYDYKFAQIGTEKWGEYTTIKYGANEHSRPAKNNKARNRLTVLMLEPQKIPAQLSMVMCYIYALPKLPGIPVSVNYMAQRSKTGRLTTTLVKHLPDLAITTTPPKAWTKVKSQSELSIKGANIDYSDFFGSPAK